MSTTHGAATAARTRRSTGWRALLLVAVGSYVFYALHGLAFRLHNYDSSSVGSDLRLEVVGVVLGGVVLGAVFALTNRFAGARGRTTTAVVLGVLAAVVYPVVLYLPWSLMWGAGAILLVQDDEPSRARTAARVFGAIAVLEVLVTTLAWLLGSGWHPGCSPADCHPR